jgi:polygalacturonase
VFGAGSCLRPNVVQPYRCQNVLVDGVTIVNSPMWEIRPVLCRIVTVRNAVVNSHGTNNDGCDPKSCRDVHTPMRDIRVTDCTFDNVAKDDVIEGVTGLTLKNVRVSGK